MIFVLRSKKSFAVWIAELSSASQNFCPCSYLHCKLLASYQMFQKELCKWTFLFWALSNMLHFPELSVSSYLAYSSFSPFLFS